MSRPYYPGVKVPIVGTASDYKFTTKIVIIEGKEVICKVYETAGDKEHRAQTKGGLNHDD